MNKSDGMNYAPQGKPNAVVKAGEFVFAAMYLDHGHIYGMCNGLVEAGATLKWVYDPDPLRAAHFKSMYPTVQIADSEEQVLEDPEVHLVAAAAVTYLRADVGIRVLDAGKDYFTDKAPLTTLEQLELAKAAVRRSGRRYWCYFSERLHVEANVYADQLIKAGVIGDVINVTGFGPHRLNAPSRPQWFFEREKYGGILCDIGSHQIEQFLYYTNSSDADVVRSHVANFNHPQYPELEDYGEVLLVNKEGASQYFRVDWFTPDGLTSWGDGRIFMTGTKGYIELRKYLDVTRNSGGSHVFFVDQEGEHHVQVEGKVGYPFFGELILDILNGTSKSMTQEHVFKAAELAVLAQNLAKRIGPDWKK